MKTKSILLVLSVLFYFGCSTDDSIVPSKEIKGSLFVTVKDPAGLPVHGAAIAIGDLTGSTTEDGTYFFTQINLTGDDYLRVEKSGYFKGSRRFTTIGSHTQFLNITLLPQAEIASFNSTHGASIYIDNKSVLNFPNNAVTRADGSAYQGNVHVFADPIYGDDPQLSQKMPGTLTGLDQAGTKVVLGSLGMVAVELQGDGGELLQIASGKTVEMRLAVSALQLSKAPATIPMWYFDEVKGYWVEEGQAVLEGNSYVAQLPHFSFWNCDEPNTLVSWQARFIYEDGRPAQNVTVCMTNLSLNDQRCAETDANGVISGSIPANEAMELSVVNECGSDMLTEEVGPFSEDVKMDAKKLEISIQDVATIAGTALQCDGTPLTSGFVKVRTPVKDFIFPILDAQGHFEGKYVYCTGEIISVSVYDIEHALVSTPQGISFERALTEVSLRACDQLDEFIRYRITGFAQEYVYYLLDMSVSHTTLITSVDSIGYKGRFGWTFDGTTTGQFKGYALGGNQINLPNGQVGHILKMDINVSEFGGAGQYVRGNFSGKINAGSNGIGGPGQSDFNGSFAVRNK